MAKLSFNVSVAGNKSFLETYTEEFQIMPSQRKIITPSMIASFPEIAAKRLSCVHTSYLTRVFSEKILSVQNFQRTNLLNYLALAERIGFSSILIHGPESMREWRFIDSSFEIVKELNKEHPDVNVIVEIPSFKGDFINELKQLMTEDSSVKYSKSSEISVTDYISYYLDRIIKNGFEIVLDTAHLFANGCTVEDMIALFTKYAKNMRICHLNGNKNKMFTSDAHCPIFSTKNQIEKVDVLMRFLAKTSLLMITENTSDGTDYVSWQRFAEFYDLKIIANHENINC